MDSSGRSRSPLAADFRPVAGRTRPLAGLRSGPEAIGGSIRLEIRTSAVPAP
jgi:hypothetical protein